jgi:hypothetical protein
MPALTYRFRVITGVSYLFSPQVAYLEKIVYPDSQRIALASALSTIFQNTDDFEHFQQNGMADSHVTMLEA